jgi:LPXTG-motif cell wall-anchored protein
MKSARSIVVALASVLLFFGFGRSAHADPTCGLPTPSTVSPGGTFTVSGFGDTNGQEIFVFLDHIQVGATFTNTSGTPITYTVVGTVPASTPANTQHTVQVAAPNPSRFIDCGTITVAPAAAATATPAPTTAPAPTPTVVFVPVTTAGVPLSGFPLVVQQQQQQQQQQGGGGIGRGQSQGDPARSAGGQQQQQQQQQQSGISGVTLPRTGADIARTAAWGGGLIAFGLILVLWARRRRRKARARALAELPPIDAVVVEPAMPWLPGSPHPSEFLTEADGVPPEYMPEPTQLYLPAPVEETEDYLTPSF